MKECKRIVIADTQDEAVEQLTEALNAERDMAVVAFTRSGATALRLCRDIEPDLLIMDLVFEDMDGAALLDQVDLMGARPQILVTSSLSGERRAVLAAVQGADYFMPKPCDPAAVVRRVRQMLEPLQSRESEMTINAYVTGTLRDMGVPAHIDGYQFLRTAILLATRDNGYLSAVTKRLYPAVAKTYESTPARVERSMRHAIELAWERGDAQRQEEYFGCTLSGARGKPTNSEFVAMVVERICQNRKAIFKRVGISEDELYSYRK